MNVTAKQRKFFVWCGVIMAAWYVYRSVTDSANRAAYLRQQAMRAAQRQKQKPKAAPPVKTIPAAPAPGIAHGPAPARTRPKPAPPSPFAKLSGVWRGRVALDGRGTCDLKFELHERQGESGHFTGYSTMTCNASGPLMATKRIDPRKRTLNTLDPEAAIFSGTADNGSIELHADKIVNADANGCAPTSFSLAPFGANQLAAEWRENTCEGGRMILRKARQ
jgi:hypothetical protein